MGFLRRLFSSEKKTTQGDPQGLYFYVQCDHCGTRLRIRADKQYDLNRTDDGYTWHKTIVDSKCFRQIPTVVQLDRNYEVVSAEIDGGHYITREEYKAPELVVEPEPGAGDDETLVTDSGEQEPSEPSTD